ncbi:MAG: PAS domain-containing protein [Acidimicrobiia bacterium]
MNDMTVDPRDEGGEAPCFAPLLEPSLSLNASALARLVSDLADAVIIADGDGTIMFWNEAAQRLFGWSEDEAVGRSLDLIIPERLRARHWAGYAHVMETGHTDYGSRLLEVPALHHDGHTLSVAFTVTLLTAPGGERPIGIAAVLRDDTARRHELLGLKQRVATLETLDAAPPPPV